MVPPTPATLALELTDTGERIEYHLPEPGPVTTMRGPASDLLLALWRRRDPLAYHAGGDRGVLEAWPKI
ncbi:MAG: C-terminal domain [Pseudonocardia sp.]